MARTKHKSSDDLKRKRDDKDDISTLATKLATKKAATSPSLSTEIDKKNGTTKQGPRKLNRPPDAIDIDEAIGHMDNSLLADHFAKQIRRYLGDLSTAELDEKYMPLKAFLNTSEFESTRNLSTLPQYIETFTLGGRDELRDTVEATSSPHTLFIASSGIRAADLTRSLRVFQSDKSAVAKLFAKHIKLAESVEYVKKTRIGIGVGTPARVQDLINTEALKTSNLKRIVIDGSYIDQKKRSIFDMKEIFVPLLDFLSRKKLKKRYEDGTLQVLVF